MKSIFHLTCVAALLILFSGCQKVYYQTMEKLGYPKRDLLVREVEKARDSQKEAKDQFESALERFSAVAGYEGGDLEDLYRSLSSEYEESKTRAEAVQQRIEAVSDVAGALFEEWEKEIDQYGDNRLRQVSRQKLSETRSRYKGLIEAMKRAEKKIPPVLTAFNDQVLYLKHNLNARAVASLKNEVEGVRSEVGALIREMTASIQQAERFILQMEKE
ncbi:MAG: DUF2959 domain-containing protein [Desulfobacteraceae bacterium]|nr:MAG: DUF2959 domain-containing protein [Desulfobacteraceae bacterium]